MTSNISLAGQLLFVLALLLGTGASICAAQPEASDQVEKSNRSAKLYLLGPGDEIRVQQPNAEELDGKSARIDESGFASLPLIGRVHLGGLTTEQAESALTEKLRTLLMNPAPVVSIAEYRSQPVSVIGAVNNPGVIQLQGHKTLLEVLSAAGGLRQDSSGEVQITRRAEYGRIPLANETPDASNHFSTAKVDLASLFKGKNPADNIAIFPQDVISVPRTEMVYVTGTVKKPG